jgi:hypothetical protein
VLQYGVNLIGENRANTKIIKDSTTTKTVTVVAGGLVVYGGSVLPSDINAILVLTGTPGPGRYIGEISNITFEGTLATSGDFESQKVEFGVVSIGSVSDFTFRECNIVNVQYSLILPVIFVAEIINNRITGCLYGPAINNGTSTQYAANYANNCRSWGHFLHDLKYSHISGNACDDLNNPTNYPDRSVVCSAYRLRSVLGCDVIDNGDEGTWGRSYFLDSFDSSRLANNLSIRLGSDYSGSDEIAWIYSTEVLRMSQIVNNMAYDVKPGGLIQGSANPAKHHNLYFEGTTFVQNSIIENNIARASRLGNVVEAGWGNNVPSSWVVATRGGDIIQTFSPTLTASTVGDLSVVYNAGDKHYRQNIGSICHVWGRFDVTLTYTTASSFLIFQGFPTNQLIIWNIDISSVEGGGALTKKLGSFRLNAGQGSGIARDTTDNPFNITDIPSGTTLQIFYDGWYQTT